MAVKVKQHKGKWWVFIDHKGRRKAKCIGTSKRAAELVAEKIQAKITLGQFGVPEHRPPEEHSILPAIPIPAGSSGECVYFLQAGDHNTVKIGYTTDLTRRLGSLSTASPYPLRLLAVVESGTLDTEA